MKLFKSLIMAEIICTDVHVVSVGESEYGCPELHAKWSSQVYRVLGESTSQEHPGTRGLLAHSTLHLPTRQSVLVLMWL